jgi:hypothetical protein
MRLVAALFASLVTLSAFTAHCYAKITRVLFFDPPSRE